MQKHSISKKRFEEIVGQFTGLNMLIVGDVGVDRYTIGKATRLNPEAPVPVVEVTDVRDKLGLAANVADNIKAFGASPHLVSVIGKDRYGEELANLMRERGLSSKHLLVTEGRRTTMKERVIAQSQQVVRIDHEEFGPIPVAAAERLWKEIEAAAPSCDGIIIEDYAKGVLTEETAQKVIALAKKHKKRVSVDPPGKSNPLHLNFFRGCTMITPNLQEARGLTSIDIVDEKSLHRAGEFLLKELAAEVVVITQGKDGMTLFPRGEKSFAVPTFARAVFDVSGAGDTVIAMQSLANAAGASLMEAALLSNFAAGCEVGKPGTATVSIEELRDYMEELGGFSS